MEPIPTFFLEPTDRVHRQLRRYASDGECPLPAGYHNGWAFLDIIERPKPAPGEYELAEPHLDHADERWPKTCECGYVFDPADNWQIFTNRLYRRIDNGQEMTLRDAPPGAMYFADWMIENWDKMNLEVPQPWGPGPDGHFLVVKCPPLGHEWNVDARASNCDKKQDNAHRCWVRHGDPKTGKVTVDKAGLTCNAGAGSILVGKEGTPSFWHGHLIDGWLRTC